MIFPGDYLWRTYKRHFGWKSIVGELIAGVKSNIPLCCVVYYLVVFRLHLVFKSVKLLDFFYPDSDTFFNKEGYHRCILCSYRNSVAKVAWNGINEWQYYR